MTADKQIEFCIADLPFHLLVAAWLYRRLCGIETGSISCPEGTEKVVFIDAAKAYDASVGKVIRVEKEGRFAKWLSALLKNYSDKRWEDIKHLISMGATSVYIVELEKEE